MVVCFRWWWPNCCAFQYSNRLCSLTHRVGSRAPLVQLPFEALTHPTLPSLCPSSTLECLPPASKACTLSQSFYLWADSGTPSSQCAITMPYGMFMTHMALKSHRIGLLICSNCLGAAIDVNHLFFIIYWEMIPVHTLAFLQTFCAHTSSPIIASSEQNWATIHY